MCIFASTLSFKNRIENRWFYYQYFQSKRLLFANSKHASIDLIFNKTNRTHSHSHAFFDIWMKMKTNKKYHNKNVTHKKLANWDGCSAKRQWWNRKYFAKWWPALIPSKNITIYCIYGKIMHQVQYQLHVRTLYTHNISRWSVPIIDLSILYTTAHGFEFCTNSLTDANS